MPTLIATFSLFLAVSLSLTSPAEARGSKAPSDTTDGVQSGRGSVNFAAASSADDNPGMSSYRRGGRCRGSQESAWLARAATKGAGRISGAGAVCYVAVKRIIADAFDKKLACTRQFIHGGSAKNAGTALKAAGFVNVKNSDPDACFCPGTIRVYSGKSVRGINDSAGTVHGHIEVVGEEGCFHHFSSSCTSSDKKFSVGSQTGRPLTGCWVMPDGGSKRSNLARCPASNTGQADGDSGGGDGRPYRGRGER